MFRVLSAPIIRSTVKTAGAIIGTVHVSVRFKSVERCPRSGVYFTMSWPTVPMIASAVLIVLLMMGAESTWNTYSTCWLSAWIFTSNLVTFPAHLSSLECPVITLLGELRCSPFRNILIYLMRRHFFFVHIGFFWQFFFQTLVTSRV
jgi:hypothetical protein